MNICDDCGKKFKEEPNYLEGPPWATKPNKVCPQCYENR